MQSKRIQLKKIFFDFISDRYLIRIGYMVNKAFQDIEQNAN